MAETFDKRFLDLLTGLNRDVAQTNEPVEGNLFYRHEDPEFPNAKINSYFAEKRENLLTACRGRGKVLEIGVNAGHSALMMLYHNPDLHYVGVDVCVHKYTKRAMVFLDRHFPGRTEFFVGDSVLVLPEIRVTRPDLRFDMVHVDGLHTLNHCKTDTYNAIGMCAPFAWCIIDDTDMPHIDEFYKKLVTANILLPKKPEGWKDKPYHQIGMLAK